MKNQINIVRLIKLLGEGFDTIVYDFQCLKPEFNISALEIDPENRNDYYLVEFYNDKEYHYPHDFMTDKQELDLLKELENLI
jgi:hypothetical protein